jgi:putative membrane protein
VKDHGKANLELMGLAKKLAVKLPAAPNAAQQAMGKKLMSLKGAAFDSAYLAAMKQGHVDTVALFESEVASGKDPQVKAWAAKVLPTIKGHLATVQQLLKGHGMKSTM